MCSRVKLCEQDRGTYCEIVRLADRPGSYGKCELASLGRTLLVTQADGERGKQIALSTRVCGCTAGYRNRAEAVELAPQFLPVCQSGESSVVQVCLSKALMHGDERSDPPLRSLSTRHLANAAQELRLAKLVGGLVVNHADDLGPQNTAARQCAFGPA